MLPAPTRLLVLLPSILLLACGDKKGDTGTEATGFCYQMADADSTTMEDGGGTASAGQLSGRLITDESDDLHDPAIVANVDYTIENVDVGGSPSQGSTEADGSFSEGNLSPGNWRINLSDSKGGYTCRNSLDFVVEAGKTTRMCLDVGCE